MNVLAYEVGQALQSVDSETATRLERLVRDALDLVKPLPQDAGLRNDRENRLQRLHSLRSPAGKGRQGASSEEILDELRFDRC